MRKNSILLAVAALLLATACASNRPTPVPIDELAAKQGFTLGEPVKRIRDVQINSWTAVDRKHAIIYVGANRRYLITTRNPCDGLDEAEHLNYSTTVGSLTDKDKLLLRRSSGRVESCFIDTLHELQKAPK